MNIEEANSTREAEGSATAEGLCANCETRLLGPHCYACGQPVKGMVRHFSSILGDLFDTLLALDSRIVRTLGPLLARPGFLTGEYFAGRRVRYVSPVRLFIFLCLTTFFIVQLSSDWGDINVMDIDSEIARAETVGEVERLRDEILADLAEAQTEGADLPTALPGLGKAERKVQWQAELRTAQLNGEELPPEPADEDGDCLLGLGEDCWNPEVDPVEVAVFPQALNDWLTVQATRANANAKVIGEDPNRFKKALIGAIPSTLLVLLPIFALMLWFLYLFKRRLYMEHLIVALHSHAFLCLALLLVTLFADTRASLQEYALVNISTRFSDMRPET